MEREKTRKIIVKRNVKKERKIGEKPKRKS
jgi:hypothetical protein